MRQAGYGILQHYYASPLYALTRFGKWDEILKEPAPAEDLLYPRGVWHYARLGKPGVAGSDAHRTPEVGRCATVFQADMIASERDLLAALQSGRFHAAKRQAGGGFVAVGEGI